MFTIQLNRGVNHRVLSGHCWVYESEIAKDAPTPPDGSIVKLLDDHGRFLGLGLYNGKSQIRVRLISRHNDEINTGFFHYRLRAAWEHRQRYAPTTDCCRVVASEADSLPGLIVDKYGDHLVLQTLTLGLDNRKAELVKLLVDLLKPAAIIERNDAPVRRYEGLEPVRGILHGQTDGRVNVEVGGLKFSLNLLEGHKTGFYLDQQVNYARVAALAAGRKVLDAFSYMGAFSLFCARAGAASVTAVEIDADNVAAAQANVQANGLADRIEFRTQNAFDLLSAAQKAGETYDLIILDPPSFTRTRANVPEAARGYKEIHLRALRMLAAPDDRAGNAGILPASGDATSTAAAGKMRALPGGGMLATFCCSHHVPREMFEQIIAEASADAHRPVRLLERLGQSPDHPILPAVPETEYLKGAILQVM
ncbi:MAG: class I SAM-dependent rRNA methyltransferase [Verrucomicrobia bacterium]|nr:class I SAM-dependent rRNA methyltransferase [Verrucomicrobiota bacterium]